MDRKLVIREKSKNSNSLKANLASLENVLRKVVEGYQIIEKIDSRANGEEI